MLRHRIMDFLYDQVGKKKIPHINKGMVEDFEQFVSELLAEKEMKITTDRMQNAKPAPPELNRAAPVEAQDNGE